MHNLGGKSDGLMTGRGLSNPAFSIKIVTADDSLQQKPNGGRDNPDDDFLSNLRNGTDVTAKIDDKIIKGKVVRLGKNELEDVIYVYVIDSEGKTHKIESSYIEISNNIERLPDDSRLAVTSVLAYNESKFLSYEHFFV